MSFTNFLIPSYTQMLTALSAWLAKAQDQLSHEEAESLLTARLASDMLPLATQVRFVCVQAQETVARLRGQDLPESVGALQAEGQNAGEHPGSIVEAQARIQETIALLEQLDQGELDKTLDGPVTLDLPNGMSFSLTADQYVRDWSLPQFYFHLMTAYSLLRANGVELGKADYVQHMFAYLEP